MAVRDDVAVFRCENAGACALRFTALRDDKYGGRDDLIVHGVDIELGGIRLFI